MAAAMSFFITWESCLETDVFVCASGIEDNIKKIKNDRHHAQTIAHHHAKYWEFPTSGYWDMGPDRWTDGHTRPITSFTTGSTNTSGE